MAQSKKGKIKLMYNPNLKNINPLTYEAFVKENIRWNSLTPEQQQAEYDAIYNERDQQLEEARKKCEEENRSKQEEFSRQAYINNRNPNSLNNGEAIVLWLVVMIVGTIFNERLLIWTFASVLLWLHFTREKRRAIKWGNGGKEEYYKNLEEVIKNGGKK